jgi:hypothetical protein
MSCNKNLSYLTKQVILVLSISGIALSPVFAGEEFKYNANSRRDPFIPLISETGGYASDAYEASAIEDIRLEGIVWDDVKGSIAIINGEIAKEGDYLGSVKILKINKDSVIFDVNGESVNIELNRE